jgi:cytochrome c biogenesis protein CcmG/thiol:disulfide interchange protein DsbE
MRGSLAIGDSVPEFGFTTFDGIPIKSTDFAGKVVVINFWASWCKPCEQEARELEAAYQYYLPGSEVIFLGMTYSDTEPNSLAYLEKFGITYPNGPDLATRASQMFRVTGVPETFVIDKKGRLAHFKAGPFTSTEEIIRVVDSVLEQ